MALERALLALFMGSCLALHHVPLDDSDGENRKIIPKSSSASGVWRTMGNYTQVEDMTLYSPIPALKGCQGFDCIERYVTFNDGAFTWGVDMDPKRLEYGAVPLTEYRLKLSSQAWMAEETHRDAWTHGLKVFVPDTYSASGKSADLAILFVEIDDHTWAAREMAMRTGAVTAVITNVPNAPLSFEQEGKYAMGEEALKAWSWYKFVHDASHPEWPVEMPNVKAVVRGMDAIAAFTRDGTGHTKMAPTKRFAIVGHSKRAMAVYMAAAVDSRVKAIVPIGISLNLYQTVQESNKNLGGVPFAALPYKENQVLDLTQDDMKKLEAISDPLHYVDRLKMPKLTIFSGADDFFPPDVSRSWWWQLPQQKMMYMFGDSNHRGITEEHNNQDKFLDVADSFLSGFMSGEEMPEISWTIDAESGNILVKQVSHHTPTSVVVMGTWTRDDKRRDFRGTRWTNYGPLEPVAGGDGRTWEAKPPTNNTWVGFFVAFEYAGPRSKSTPWRLSTEVSVMPNVRPFPEAETVEPKWQTVVMPPDNPFHPFWR